MSSRAWFKQAKAAVALAAWMDRLELWGASFEPVLEDLPEDLRREGQTLVGNFRLATIEREHKQRAPRDRRARTDAGRETDAHNASAGNLVK